jgi:hypothetical protein
VPACGSRPATMAAPRSSRWATWSASSSSTSATA